jgi:hypothetical protein
LSFHRGDIIGGSSRESRKDLMQGQDPAGRTSDVFAAASPQLREASTALHWIEVTQALP